MKKSQLLYGCIIGMLTLFSTLSYGQLVINTSMTPQQWVQNVLIGQGVTVSNVTFTGDAQAAGTFMGTSNLGLSSGVILTSGNASLAPGPNQQTGAGLNNGGGTDPDLAMIGTGAINDACVLEFDFVPESDTVQFRYVFGSEEYNEYVNATSTTFNDVFGFFLSGPGITGPFSNNAVNIALVPGTNPPQSVAIHNINNGWAAGGNLATGPCKNCLYYIDNAVQSPNPLNIQYDGFTVILVAKHWVQPCSTYHIKLAISDVSDGILDSGVFLEANSFGAPALAVNLSYVSPSNPGLAAPMAVEGCRKAVVTFTIPSARPDTVKIYIDSIHGSAVNGVDYTLIDTFATVLPYHVTTQVVIDPIYDGIAEGVEYVKLRIRTSICGDEDTTLIIPIFDYFYIEVDDVNDTIVCEGEVPLWVTPTGGFPPYYIQWTPIATLTNPNSTNPIASPQQPTMYYVEVKDSTRCSIARDSVMIDWFKNPLISFKPSLYEGCDSVVVQFTNNTAPDIGTYLWEFGDGTTATVANPLHTFYYDPNIPAFSVKLTATTVNGCSKEYAIPNLIKVYPGPEAAFTPLPDSTTLENPTITFDNQSTILGTHFMWYFGDSLGSTSTEYNPQFTYYQDGLYTVWLYVTTDHGCRDSVSETVLVVKEVDYDLTIPNIITPNSDGKNDKFVIENLENYTINVLSIYNRWGKKVFEQSPYLNEWNGENLPDGTYFVVLRYKKKQEEYKYDGVITILR